MEQSRAPKKVAKFQFTTTLFPSDGWVCLSIPPDVSQKLPSRGQVPINGHINEFPIRTSVFPTGEGTHLILINKEMQKGAKVGVGDRVEVILEVDTAPRTVPVSPRPA